MNFRIVAAAVGALLLSGAAYAEETVESLRQPVIDVCKSQMGEQAPEGKTVEGVCTCMIDGIIKDFGDDALPMLKVLKAGLNPGQEAEIATLLGTSEADTKAFIERANAKIDPIQASCTK